MAIEKLPHLATRISRCVAVVFHPVTEHGPAGLQVRVIETVVRAGKDDLLDLRALVAPADDLFGAVCRRRPIVEGPNEFERGYPRTRSLRACTEDRTQPPPGTARCSEGQTVRTNWSPPPRGWPNRLARRQPRPHVVDRRKSGEPRTRDHHRHLTGVCQLWRKIRPRCTLVLCRALQSCRFGS